MNKNIYMILFDWSTTDSDGIETFLFHRFEDAVNKFNKLIEDERNPDVSWVGSEAFDEHGNVNDGYELDRNTNDKRAENLYWRVVDKNDYNRRSFIDLYKKEIY